MLNAIFGVANFFHFARCAFESMFPPPLLLMHPLYRMVKVMRILSLPLIQLVSFLSFFFVPSSAFNVLESAGENKINYEIRAKKKKRRKVMKFGKTKIKQVKIITINWKIIRSRDTERRNKQRYSENQKLNELFLYFFSKTLRV